MSDERRAGGGDTSSSTAIQSLRQGAIWVGVTSALALPLSYVRNLLLGGLDETGELAGTFATLIVLFAVVRTFMLFGGTTAVTHFVASMKDSTRKGEFLLVYCAISLVFALTILLPLVLWPSLLDRFVEGEMTDTERMAVLGLSVVFLLNQLAIYGLAGLMEFRLLAIVSQFQLFCVLTLLCVSGLVAPDWLREHALVALAVTMAGAHLLGFTLALYRIWKCVGLPKAAHLPQGFWRYATQVHANTLTAFAYNNIDQLYILSQIGVGELGGYFLLLQISELIKFVPQRIGQVMLASFSRLIADDEHDRLVSVYQRLCRLTILLSTAITIGMIYLSKTVSGLFGDWLGESHQYLILLAATANIGCIGSPNQMLILAKKQAGPFLVNNVALTLAQILTMLLLIPDYGVYGAIWGRLVGVVIGQTGMFWILRSKISDMRLPIPSDFFISQLVVLGSAAAVWSVEWTHPLWGLAAGLGVGLLYLLVVRLRPSELSVLLQR